MRHPPIFAANAPTARHQQSWKLPQCFATITVHTAVGALCRRREELQGEVGGYRTRSRRRNDRTVPLPGLAGGADARLPRHHPPASRRVDRAALAEPGARRVASRGRLAVAPLDFSEPVDT